MLVLHHTAECIQRNKHNEAYVGLRGYRRKHFHLFNLVSKLFKKSKRYPIKCY